MSAGAALLAAAVSLLLAGAPTRDRKPPPSPGAATR
jgi:hypothetical protein